MDDYERFLESLPDPDMVGTTEYRAVHDLVTDCDSFELATAACHELIERSLSMIVKLEAFEEGLEASTE